jgi:hypothetical protein
MLAASVPASSVFSVCNEHFCVVTPFWGSAVADRLQFSSAVAGERLGPAGLDLGSSLLLQFLHSATFERAWSPPWRGANARSFFGLGCVGSRRKTIGTGLVCDGLTGCHLTHDKDAMGRACAPIPLHDGRLRPDDQAPAPSDMVATQVRPRAIQRDRDGRCVNHLIRNLLERRDAARWRSPCRPMTNL